MISEEPTSLNTHSISFDLYKWPIFYFRYFYNDNIWPIKASDSKYISKLKSFAHLLSLDPCTLKSL